MREPTPVENLTNRQLWELLDLSLSQVSAELDNGADKRTIRRPLARAVTIARELKMRGTQMSIERLRRE